MFLISSAIFFMCIVQYIYWMQETIASNNLSTKLQRITNKVNRFLSEKYKFQHNKDGEGNESNQIKLSTRDIENALQKSQKMTSKLKLIRTLLGYQNSSTQKQAIKTKYQSQQKKAQEKGVSLKQFVISMRKKSEVTDHYFKLRKNSSTNPHNNNFVQQNQNMQQYTDASLKYIHSFLPHQTTISKIDHFLVRRKKSIQQVSQTLNYADDYQLVRNDRPYETIQDQNDQNNRFIAQLQGQQLSLMRSKKSLNVSVYNKRSQHLQNHTIMSKQEGERIQRFANLYRKQSINLPLVQNELNVQRRKNPKPSNITVPLTTELIYKGKYYHKQLKNNHHSLEKTVGNAKQRSEKKANKQLLPTIKQCVPMIRPKQSNVSIC